MADSELANGSIIGDGHFEIRLTEPIFSRSAPAMVNGLGELFEQTTRSATEPLIFLICSAWLSTEAFRRLADSLQGTGHHLFVLTNRAHEFAHWKKLMAAWKELTTTFSLIEVGLLPKKYGPHPVTLDALHAKLYVVGSRNSLLGEADEAKPPENRKRAIITGLAETAFLTPIECFFGSANFTTAGLGQKNAPETTHDSGKKWEIIGRAIDDEAKRTICWAFNSLWQKADIFVVEGETALGTPASAD